MSIIKVTVREEDCEGGNINLASADKYLLVLIPVFLIHNRRNILKVLLPVKACVIHYSCIWVD